MRIRLALGLIAALVWTGAAQARQAEPRAFAVLTADMYSPAVAELKITTSGANPERRAAGFFIGPGRFATTRSTLVGATSAVITLDSGQSLPVTKIVAEDVEADLAVIFAEVPSALRRGLMVSRLPAINGEDAVVIGPPAKPGEDLPDHPVAPVRVGAKAAIGAAEAYELRGAVDASLAGAPVLAASGQVIGVVAAKAGETGQRLAVSGVRLAEMMDAPGLPLAEWSAGRTVASTRPSPAEAEAAAGAKAKVTTRDDGTMVIDDRFTVTGQGTSESPYKITWDLLVSASEDYAPKQGRNHLPDRITMFEGKFIEITGYVTFPVMAEEPIELLSMMNQWDGCCIGVPPTPYDAIEARLINPVKGQARLTTYGTIKGRLRADPQLVGNWLVGLYVMDDVTLTGKSFGGFAP